MCPLGFHFILPQRLRAKALLLAVLCIRSIQYEPFSFQSPLNTYSLASPRLPLAFCIPSHLPCPPLSLFSLSFSVCVSPNISLFHLIRPQRLHAKALLLAVLCILSIQYEPFSFQSPLNTYSLAYPRLPLAFSIPSHFPCPLLSLFSLCSMSVSPPIFHSFTLSYLNVYTPRHYFLRCCVFVPFNTCPSPSQSPVNTYLLASSRLHLSFGLPSLALSSSCVVSPLFFVFVSPHLSLFHFILPQRLHTKALLLCPAHRLPDSPIQPWPVSSQPWPVSSQNARVAASPILRPPDCPTPRLPDSTMACFKPTKTRFKPECARCRFPDSPTARLPDCPGIPEDSWGFLRTPEDS